MKRLLSELVILRQIGHGGFGQVKWMIRRRPKEKVIGRRKRKEGG